MTRKPRKVCIVSPYSYPLFNPERGRGHFGGWEVRVSLIAKELAKRGSFEVSMLVWDCGQPHVERREGVTLYSWTGKPDPSILATQNYTVTGVRSSFTPDKPSPGSHSAAAKGIGSSVDRRKRTLVPGFPRMLAKALGALYYRPRWAAVSFCGRVRGAVGAGRCRFVISWRRGTRRFGSIGGYTVMRDSVAIYDEIDADIYLVPGNHNRAAEVAYYCRRKGKRYVFLSGSDLDYDPIYKADPEKVDIYGVPGYLKLFAIENAALHIVQSDAQADCLRRNYGRASVVVRNPLDTTPAFPKKPDAAELLWVGSADDRVRRPSLALELARRMPEHRFVIVMVPAVPQTYAECAAAARSLRNVALVGRTPFREFERRYAEARILINTSLFEGFPNSFLQAAKYGVPVVALKVDPGEMLTRHGCGITCGDSLDDMKQNIDSLLSDPVLYARISANCVRYVTEFHDKEKIIPQLDQSLLGLL